MHSSLIKICYLGVRMLLVSCTALVWKHKFYSESFEGKEQTVEMWTGKVVRAGGVCTPPINTSNSTIIGFFFFWCL